jgi:hypothetical protein
VIFDEASPDQDRCEMCPPDTYLLARVSNASMQCKPCPIGARCTGGNSLEAQEGYFLSIQHGPGLQSAGGANLSFEVIGAAIFRCPPESCGENNSCKGDRVGPVCGLCPHQWALTTSGCLVCPPDERLAALRVVVYAVVAVLLLLLWVFLSWRPLLPQVDAVLARFGQMLGMCFKSVLCLGGSSDLGEERNNIGQNFEAFNESLKKLYQDLGMSNSGDFLKILKILASYFQVRCFSDFCSLSSSGIFVGTIYF